MQTKNIKFLVIVFAVLLVITAIPWAKEKMGAKEKTVDKFENVSVNLAQFSKENTEKISISKGEEKIDLVFKDGVWMLGDKEVSAEKMDSLFTNLKVAKVQKESSKNKDNQAKFEVDQEQAIVLSITANGNESVFFIGKNGPSFDSFYARQKGIVNVYLVEGNLKNILLLDEAEWIKSEDESAETEKTPATIEMPR
jgi:hypothetical protein